MVLFRGPDPRGWSVFWGILCGVELEVDFSQSFVGFCSFVATTIPVGKKIKKSSDMNHKTSLGRHLECWMHIFSLTPPTPMRYILNGGLNVAKGKRWLRGGPATLLESWLTQQRRGLGREGLVPRGGLSPAPGMGRQLCQSTAFPLLLCHPHTLLLSCASVCPALQNKKMRFSSACDCFCFCLCIRTPAEPMSFRNVTWLLGGSCE